MEMGGDRGTGPKTGTYRTRPRVLLKFDLRNFPSCHRLRRRRVTRVRLARFALHAAGMFRRRFGRPLLQLRPEPVSGSRGGFRVHHRFFSDGHAPCCSSTTDRGSSTGLRRSHAGNYSTLHYTNFPGNQTNAFSQPKVCMSSNYADICGTTLQTHIQKTTPRVHVF